MAFMLQDTSGGTGKTTMEENRFGSSRRTTVHGALDHKHPPHATATEKEIEEIYPDLIASILVTGESRAEEALPEIQN